jgi:hypothetical protein
MSSEDRPCNTKWCREFSGAIELIRLDGAPGDDCIICKRHYDDQAKR